MANSTVYKVVRLEERKLEDGRTISVMRSARVSPYSKYCLTYEVGKSTVPSVGKLFAFGSLKSARYFRTNRATHEIWRASGENASKPTPLRWRLFIDAIGKDIRAFWDRWLAKTEEVGQASSCHITFTPKGTVACDSITLKERVY